jgi:hypothetical protein
LYFQVGNVTLGSPSGIPSDGKVTPQDVAGVSRAATAAPSALAIAQFLQSLNDGTTAGKIVIPAATSTALNTTQPITLVSSNGVFHNQICKILSLMLAKYWFLHPTPKVL